MPRSLAATIAPVLARALPAGDARAAPGLLCFARGRLARLLHFRLPPLPGARTDRGVAVSCARPGESIAFVETP